MDENEAEFIPRPYQVQLMDVALKRNSIIYLPTGSGKTFIAILVLKHLSGDLEKCYHEGGKLSIILVNSVPLVDQHQKYVQDHTTLRVGTYSGEMNLDFWTREEWMMQFSKFQVLVMTTQILVNIEHNKFIDLNKVNLIIFDECHRGVENHAMRQLMKSFKNLYDPPRILGLTATLLNGNCKLTQVIEKVKTLEITYHSQVATVDGLDDVMLFSTNPQERFEIHHPSFISDESQQAIEYLYKTVTLVNHCNLEKNGTNKILPKNLQPLDVKNISKDLCNLIQDLIIHIKMLGSYGGYKACIAHMIQVERIRLHCQDQTMALVLLFVLTAMDNTKAILKNSLKSFCSGADKIYKGSSDKVCKLLNILKHFEKISEQELCCLIFVQRRFTAKIMHHILKSLSEVDSAFYHIRSNFVVGNNNNPYNDTRENAFIIKKNREILSNFVNKEINVLVSSNVLEEGIDIPKCTLVVKFDKSEDYRSYIQSKGRARHRTSLFYTLVQEDERVNYLKKYEVFQKVEEILNDFLVGKNTQRFGPHPNDINAMYNEDIIPPYFANGPDSSYVNMDSAISLLCQYCTSLAGNNYTTYSPEWYLEIKELKVQVTIYLPVVCPILKPIEGPLMSNKKLAKKAAALYACIKLHKCKELDDTLKPRKKELLEEDISFLFHHWPAQKDERAGFKKNKRLHVKQAAACVTGALESFKILYLHVIRLRPKFERPDHIGSILYDMYLSPLCFGLLTPNTLMTLCNFPIYDSNGEIEVELETNVLTVSLTDSQLLKLRGFHFLIFSDLLEILKPYLIFDNSGNSDMMLLVPVKGKNIDFDTVNQHKELKPKQQEPSATERMKIEVGEESYLNKIVIPWYRAEVSVYVVVDIINNETPLSDFPSVDYASYSSYFKNHYNLTILNTTQPLLLVKGLTKALNFLKPKGIHGKRKWDKRYQELEEKLIPELVVKQDFPACLWIQAKFLPTILSRISYLLKLQQLQCQIARSLKVTSKYLNDCPALQLDEYLLNYVPFESEQAKRPDNAIISNISNISEFLPLESSSLLTLQYNKDFVIKKLESEYAWRNIDEPKDIERDLDVTVADIEYYETFINSSVKKNERMIKNDSPIKNNSYKAITYDVPFVEKPLNMLRIKFRNQCPNLCEFYQALTAAEANDIVNLERLEILGDSFLKVIASFYIIFKFPSYNEGKATTLKGRLISNKNLYYLAEKKNLGGIIRNSDLSPREDWVPPCFCVPEKIKERIVNRELSVIALFDVNVSIDEQISGVLSDKTWDEVQMDECSEGDDQNTDSSMCHFLQNQYVGDKTLADASEALIGAFFRKGGIECGINFMHWLGLFPAGENVKHIIDTAKINPILNPDATRANVDFHIPQWVQFEKRLGYRFKNRAFLLQALTHSSYSPNRITQSYEKLEFIGDAVLDFLITCYIYEYCGNLNPGQVTDLRSALVNNNTFASLTVRCEFHKFMLMINLKLQGHIDKFTEYLAMKNYVIDDEVLILIEEGDLNMAEYVDVPKVLGDVFEALAGAVFLDSGKDLLTVWKVFYKIMFKEIDLFTKNVPKNVLRKLYECHTAYPVFSKATEIPETNKTMVSLEFMCEGRLKRVHGFGINKSAAKKAAAKIALRSLKL